MRIIGFGFKKISIEKKKEIDGKIEIKSNINIEDISKDKVDISEKDALKFSFTFTINYNPGITDIEFKGHIITLTEKDETKEIINDWKTKKLSEGIRIPLFNFIMNKCSLKAINLEEDFNLPLHIPMPRIEAKPQEDTNSSNTSK